MSGNGELRREGAVQNTTKLNTRVGRDLLCSSPNSILACSMHCQAPNILSIAAFVQTPWLGQGLRACVGKVQSTFTHHAPLCYTMHPRKSWAGFTFHLTQKLRVPSKSGFSLGTHEYTHEYTRGNTCGSCDPQV